MAHFLRHKQERGFDALRTETQGFTEFVFDRHPRNIGPGEELAIYNSVGKQLSAIVVVRTHPYHRMDGPNLDLWPWGVRTDPPAPEMELAFAPQPFPSAPRNRAPYQRISDELFGECVAWVRRYSTS